MELAIRQAATNQFYDLTPQIVLEGVERAGFSVTGQYLQLNSYENRVFEIFLEPGTWEAERLIAKYYRPARWSLEAILEEHRFLEELKQAGLPVVEPVLQANGSTVSDYEQIYLSLFPKVYGRLPQELGLPDLRQLGRFLAQIHNVGSRFVAQHRPAMEMEETGYLALETLARWVAPEVWERYEEAACEILEYLEEKLADVPMHCIHGDCHRGNLLMTDRPGQSSEFFIIDFDDFRLGPAAQDFWMLFSGDGEERQHEEEAILSGYCELRTFNASWKSLYEPLRGLRILMYGGWIANRWKDPLFQQLFPQFETYSYWAEETEALEKIAWRL